MGFWRRRSSWLATRTARWKVTSARSQLAPSRTDWSLGWARSASSPRQPEPSAVAALQEALEHAPGPAPPVYVALSQATRPSELWREAPARRPRRPAGSIPTVPSDAQLMAEARGRRRANTRPARSAPGARRSICTHPT